MQTKLLGRTVRGTYVAWSKDEEQWVPMPCQGEVIALTSNSEGELYLWVLVDGDVRKVRAASSTVLPHDYQGALR